MIFLHGFVYANKNRVFSTKLWTVLYLYFIDSMIVLNLEIINLISVHNKISRFAIINIYKMFPYCKIYTLEIINSSL